MADKAETWANDQVQNIVEALKIKRSGTFQMIPDWGPASETEKAFDLVGAMLSALGYDVRRDGPKLQVARR